MAPGIVVRSSLQAGDFGPSLSPDIICTQQTQLQNPAQAFTASYQYDPNEPVMSDRTNYIYMRGRNTGQIASAATVYLYWCPSSMLLMPEQWKQNALSANVDGALRPYNALPEAGPNQITVTPAPFVWTPPPAGQHYCLVGALSTPQAPWTSDDLPTFPTWDAFVVWMYGNPNICRRSVTLVPNPAPPQWERLDLLNNSFSQDIPMLMQVECINVPVGTVVRLAASNLGIGQEAITVRPSQTVYSRGATVPAGYQGYVETIAMLPPGTSWPPGAFIQTSIFFGAPSESDVSRFAHNFLRDEYHPSVMATRKLARSANGIGALIKVGASSTRYQPAA